MTLARASLVAPGAWTPTGVDALEANALLVVKSSDNRSVIAGPGAGKTELLAQRAAFLLQTGACPAPRRILAISYKRDAARNLSERVRARCHPTHAARLDSQTFDAFAKSLVDRFGQTLPVIWRPTPDYEVLDVTRARVSGFFSTVGSPPAEIGARADIMALKVGDFERDHLIRRRLSSAGWTARTPGGWAAGEYWRSALHGGQSSRLSFSMIGRLAELLVRTNPVLRRALRLTYSHLFMDEFQDTTQVQYDLVKAIFLDSDAVVTAVGDNKQQIMRWALAMADPFTAVDADFGAIRTPLFNNYRSSPGLVHIQHILAQALDKKAVKPVSKTASTISGDCCQIWSFPNATREAASLAAFIAGQLAGGLKPRDLAVLVRQKAEDRYDELVGPFAMAGVALRNEAGKVGTKGVSLQDLLPEEASRMPLALLRLATAKRAGKYWSRCLDLLQQLRGIDPEDQGAQARLARELDTFAVGLSKTYPTPPTIEADAATLLAAIVAFLDRDRLKSLVARYQQGGWLDDLLAAAAAHLAASAAGGGGWEATLDAYEGLHAVPLMTIHKSKGLEYHTVIFIGLDDSTWWSFKNDEAEATAGFFVAFTRARQRVVFTHHAGANRTVIAPLYQLLASAGVASITKT